MSNHVPSCFGTTTAESAESIDEQKENVVMQIEAKDCGFHQMDKQFQNPEANTM
jgi:hypothetical protein